MYVLAGCTLPTPHTFLNCPLHMILHRGNVRQYNFSKEAVSGAPVTLYWTALAISKTLWNHRLDKTSLIDMEKPGCQVPSICLCNLFTCFEVISENILLVILGKSAYAEGAMFTHCSNRFWTPYYYNRLYDVGLTLQFLKTDSTIPVAHFVVCCDSYLGMLC